MRACRRIWTWMRFCPSSGWWTPEADRAKAEFFIKARVIAERELLDQMAAFEMDLLVLAGFMRVLTPLFHRPDQYGTGQVQNHEYPSGPAAGFPRHRRLRGHLPLPAAGSGAVPFILSTMERIPAPSSARRPLRSKRTTPWMM